MIEEKSDFDVIYRNYNKVFDGIDDDIVVLAYMFKRADFSGKES